MKIKLVVKNTLNLNEHRQEKLCYQTLLHSNCIYKTNIA